MKKSDIVSYTHSSVILYLLFGCMFENQRLKFTIITSNNSVPIFN